MKAQGEESLKVTVETNRNEVMEMHLFDENASREMALCGAASAADDRRGVSDYLEDRLYGHSVGAICEGCKALAVPFAKTLIRDLEAEGQLDEADEYRQLAATLLRETSLGTSSG